jgi:hypothetical protein
MGMLNRLENLEVNVDRLQETADKFMAKANRSMTDASMKKPRSQLKKLRATMQVDTDAVGGQSHAMHAQMAQLRDHDRRLEHAEAAFDNVARAISTLLRQIIPVDSSDNQDFGPDISLCSSSAYQSVASDAQATPPLPELEQYYKAVSDMRIMQERFTYLETERQEQWGRRVLLEDQGQPLDQAHDDFIQAWEERLNVAEANFEEAKTAMEEARRTCDSAGIPIPDWGEASSVSSKHDNPRMPFEATLNSRNAQPSYHFFEGIISEPLMQNNSSPLSTPSAKSELIGQRVSQWVDDIAPMLSPVPSVQMPGASKLTPENFGGRSHFACPHSNRSVADRPTSCPPLPHPTSLPSTSLVQSRTAHSMNAIGDFESDPDFWTTLSPGLGSLP